MAKVFLSFSRRDERFVILARRALEQSGHSVYQERLLGNGESWQSEIGSLLSIADVVVVFWSKASIESTFVQHEASVGLTHNKLLPVIIDNVEIPLGFRSLQNVDLQGWTGDQSYPAWAQILQSISGITTRRFNHIEEAKLEPGQNNSLPGSRAPIDVHRRFERIASASKVSLFIAHASNDKPRLGGVVEALSQVGFTLWIDKPHLIPCSDTTKKKISRIHMGEDWKESIRQAVSSADKVMAFWSDDAIDAKREQFQYEVYQGLVQGKLFQCKLDPMPQDKIGMPYTFHQIADISDFKDSAYHYELDYLMQDIARTNTKTKRKFWLFG